MKILIGTASKEINSTKQPTLTNEIEVQLKDNVSLTSPVILIRDEVYNASWNYCYIPKWNRYYFLHDAIIQTGGIWAVALAIDVLASWKSEILASSAYIRRSASNYSNFLPDSTWSHSTQYAQTTTEINCGMSATGMFLLFTASDDAKGSGQASIPSLSVYLISSGQLKTLCNYLFSDAFFADATRLEEGGASLSDNDKILTRAFFNPFQYVVKCMWVPFLLSDFSVSASTFSFGWFDCNLPANAVLVDYVEKEFTFTLGSNTDWTSRDPGWTKNTFYVPGFGHLELSPDYQGKTLSCKIIMDVTTGEGQLMIRDSAGNLLQSATGKLGCDVQLSGLYEDFISDFGSKGSAIFNGIRAGIGGAFGASKQGLWQKMGAVQAGLGYEEANLSELNPAQLADDVVKGAQAALQPTLSTCGANGSRALIQREPKAILTVTHYPKWEDIHERLGGMCNKVLQIGTLSGYTEVVNPHINCSATSNEISMINSFLSGGFYIE